MLKVDLHYHSTFSDGRANIIDIEEKCLSKEMSLILTDHNEIRGSIRLFERGRIPTLPALEAGTREGLEFLIYFQKVSDIESFYKRAIEPYRKKRFMVQINVPAEKMLTIAKEYDCFVSLAHPFGFRKKSIYFHRANEKLLQLVYDKIDAIETFNGNISDQDNFKALEYHQRSEGLAATVGSDGHNLDSLGQVTADFNLDLDAENTKLFQNLRQGKFVKNTNNNISKLNTALNIAYSHSMFFLDDGNTLEASIKKQLEGLKK